MKGREADAWQLDVAAPPMIEPFDKLPRVVVDFVDRIVCAGFDGLLIDTRGFTSTKEGDRARAIMKIIADRYEDLRARSQEAAQSRTPERLNVIPHLDGRQFFLDLRPYRDELRRARPDYYEEMTRKEQDWVALLWLDGFESPEEPVYHDILRFAPADASAWFVNPSNRERKFGLWMTLRHGHAGAIPDALVRTPERRVRRSTGRRPTGPAPRPPATAKLATTRSRSRRAAMRSASTARRPRTSSRPTTAASASSSWSSVERRFGSSEV